MRFLFCFVLFLLLFMFLFCFVLFCFVLFVCLFVFLKLMKGAVVLIIVYVTCTGSCLLYKIYTIDGLQITVLVHFGSVWFWLVTVLLIVFPRSLLSCLFNKKLGI